MFDLRRQQHLNDRGMRPLASAPVHRCGFGRNQQLSQNLRFGDRTNTLEQNGEFPGSAYSHERSSGTSRMSRTLPSPSKVAPATPRIPDKMPSIGFSITSTPSPSRSTSIAPNCSEIERITRVAVAESRWQ